MKPTTAIWGVVGQRCRVVQTDAPARPVELLDVQQLDVGVGAAAGAHHAGARGEAFEVVVGNLAGIHQLGSLHFQRRVAAATRRPNMRAVSRSVAGGESGVTSSPGVVAIMPM